MNQFDLAALDLEIERLRPRSHFERAFAAVRPKERNPWRGATDELGSREREREGLRLRLEGERVLCLIDEYRSCATRVADSRAELEFANAELVELAQDPSVVRYTTNFTPTGYFQPDAFRPEQAHRHFTESELAIIGRWRNASHRASTARVELEHAEAELAEFHRANPTFLGIEFPNLEKVPA
jgi:hypothetical protein